MKKAITLLALVILASANVRSQDNVQAQYDTLLDGHSKGKLTTSEKIKLSYLAHGFHNDSLSNAIANDVIAKYGFNQTTLDRAMILFVVGHTKKVSDRGFDFIRTRTVDINKTIDRPYFAENAIIETILNSDTELSFVNSKSSNAPHWKNIQKYLDNKYGKNIGDWAFLGAKTRYFKLQEDWKSYSKSLVEYANKYKPALSPIGLNNFGWDIFVHSDDPEYLSIAASWLKPIVEGPEPFFGMIDTYANLLYKQNKASEAIDWETRALALAPHDAGTKSNLEKMKKGEKTWE